MRETAKVPKAPCERLFFYYAEGGFRFDEGPSHTMEALMTQVSDGVYSKEITKEIFYTAAAQL